MNFIEENKKHEYENEKIETNESNDTKIENEKNIENNITVKDDNEKIKKRIDKVDNELKYKSIYINNVYNGETSFKSDSCDMDKIDDFLNKEKESNKSQPWNKLNKTNKIDKIKEFSINYSKENNLSEELSDILQKYLLKGLDNKRFSKIKDINYNKEEGVIKDIPGLLVNKNKKIFTIKNQDNRLSTLKNLAPKTKRAKQRKNNKSRDKKD